MRLIDDWRVVLRHAWSVRFLALAGLSSGAEAILPLIGDQLPISTGLFASLSFVITVAALVARFVAQAKIAGGR